MAAMNSDLRADDWLALLAYGLDIMMRPNLLLPNHKSWYHYSDSFATDVRRLRRVRMIETAGATAAKRAIRLSEKASQSAHLAPDRLWDRPWDGKWRVFAFDLKLEEHSFRNTLWRWLRARRFGLLQRSVWVHADPIGPLPKAFQKPRLVDRAFHTFETSSISGRAPKELAALCWDFVGVNKLYSDLKAIHERGMEMAENPATKPDTKRRWLAEERKAWAAAMFLDPLLPRKLHPPQYAGPQSFARRKEVFRALAGQLPEEAKS
jgi:DNA-binding transcriptional regulator PaaX